MRKYLPVCFYLLVVVLLAVGCGGGGGSDSPSTNTNTATLYPTNEIVPFTTGFTKTLNISGTDTSGGVWKGTDMLIVDGPVTGGLIQRREIINITRVNDNTLGSSTITSYFNPDHTLNHEVKNNGVTGTPTNTFVMPTSVKIGDSGIGQGISWSDGVSENSTWQVVDGGGGNAKIIKTTNRTSNIGNEQTRTYTITPSGNVLAATNVIQNSPTVGVTTTLSYSSVSSTPGNYTGTWLFKGTEAVDTCSINEDITFTSQPRVSQSGSNVVVVSGTVTMTGTTNDMDGFDVYGPVTTGANGCQSQSGYRFTNASDGNAGVQLAIAVQCGSTQCGIRWDGGAVRQSFNTALSIVTTYDMNMDSIIDKCVQQIIENKPDSSQEKLTLDEESLKKMVTDVLKAVPSEK